MLITDGRFDSALFDQGSFDEFGVSGFVNPFSVGGNIRRAADARVERQDPATIKRVASAKLERRQE